jgi:hypothetical protein
MNELHSIDIRDIYQNNLSTNSNENMLSHWTASPLRVLSSTVWVLKTLLSPSHILTLALARIFL